MFIIRHDAIEVNDFWGPISISHWHRRTMQRVALIFFIIYVLRRRQILPLTYCICDGINRIYILHFIFNFTRPAETTVFAGHDLSLTAFLSSNDWLNCFQKKTSTHVFDYNSDISLSIFILLIPMGTGIKYSAEKLATSS